MPFPIFSLLAAAGSAIANGIASRRANRINQKQYEEVRRYNTPSAQMSRFRAAGLNPHLIYTQSNEAEQRPEWKPPQFDFSALSGAAGELSEYQNVNESRARVDNLRQQNRMIEQQVIAAAIANKYADSKERLTVSQLRETVSNLHAATNKVRYEVEKILPLEREKFDWSKTNDVVNMLFKSKEIDLALKRLNLDRYKTQIELQWQIKLNELLRQLPDFSNIDFKKEFGEAVKNSFLGNLLEFLDQPLLHKLEYQSGSGRTFGSNNPKSSF